MDEGEVDGEQIVLEFAYCIPALLKIYSTAGREHISACIPYKGSGAQAMED